MFFGQTQSAFSEICNLAMLCFETNTFPRKCAVLKAHEISLLNTRSSLDVIIMSAEEEIRRILGNNSNKQSPLNDDVQKMLISTKETDTSSPLENEQNIPDLLQDIKEIKDDGESLSVDKKSQSSSTGTRSSSSTVATSSSCDILRESMDVIIENSALCENYTLVEGESCPWCVIDKCRACFVLRYFPIMNFARIRVILSATRKCRWRTWLAYVVTLKCELCINCPFL